MVGGFCTIIDAYCTALMPNHCDSELYDHGVEHTMYKFCVITLLAFALVGCISAEQKAANRAEALECEQSGSTPYVGIGAGDLGKCASPKEQARLERLEYACVKAGGEPKYHWAYEYYLNCKQGSEVRINNNANSGFKPYCPPSKTPIYGCPPPTQVIIVD